MPGARLRDRPEGPFTWVAVLLVVCFLSITMGSRAITLETIWRALTDFDAASASETVVRQMRIPRTLLGITVGAALGLSPSRGEG